MAPAPAPGQLTPEFLGQMLHTLPAGKVVDHMAGRLLNEAAGENPLGPIATAVSSKVILKSFQLGTPARAALIAGATDPDTIQELATHAIDWCDRWALLSNSNLQTLPHLVLCMPDQQSYYALGDPVARTCFAASISAILDGKVVHREQQPQGGLLRRTIRELVHGNREPHWEADPRLRIIQMAPPTVVESYSTSTAARYWKWDSLTDDQQADLRAAHLDWSLTSRAPERLSALLTSPREYWPLADTLEGHGQLPAWLPKLLAEDSNEWKPILKAGLCNAAGRSVGSMLFDVTGDDPGLWTVALEMLEQWDRPLPEWLEAVEALQ